MAAVTAGPCHIACSRLRPRCVLAGLDPQAFRSLVSGTGATRAQMTWLVIVSRLQEGLVASPTQARAEQSSYSHPAATLLCGSLTYSGHGARARRGGTRTRFLAESRTYRVLPRCRF